MGAVLGLAALVVALVATASPAAAHARLESSSPADGSTLTAVPPEVMLRFNEPIKDGLNEVTVKSGSTNVAEGSVQVEGSTVYQPVKYSMKPGNYSISYKVVSADGHPVSGTVSFTYDPPEGDTGAGEEPGATSTSSGTDGEAPSSTSSSAAAPSSSGDGSSAGTSSSPTESGSPSESATSTSGTSEPTSTSTSPSETASTSPQSSESSSPSEEAVANPDETSGDGDDMSPWWFAIGAAVLIIILGVIAMLVRGRKRSDSDEDATLEEWRG